MTEVAVLRDCCADEDNLERQPVEERGDLIVRVCKVCGCRHFEAFAEPFTIGVEPEGGTR